ncbi:MAG: Nucleotidyltransferase family protein [Candidatus Magasanikbacteria bacterium GW2011_GWC2_40_17]|uniref:Nucleotidyltransferase family protein n=1 Tax=Candidatus Magasanikbacteria bacterium GW2011_GWA2_42_32 TaxID=1619039 RepID=A0A0G1CF98_9BACT|nr:MAG: Nucleotidyltransferase family protein [Candidatus Magasanikbacteria bacterium GW2011_GWC2_40_17]KKS57251.1 MAG: Nucleotidyltransferase family protein [Candidatus Magasanikbacteria bacterium GW2011_GWA2_42_32]OGH86141.1 MAG: hypothetical protein A2294_02705 [Candidatus Magasanikbacteria bacterium RIFOXYB2_FULL_38_10]
MNQQLPIIKTLSFFSIFQQPLTLLELKENLFCSAKTDLSQLRKDLDVLIKKGAVGTTNGFFFLSPDESLVSRRLQKIFWELPKWQIAQKAATILNLVPFIKLVAVCNSLAFGTSREESDIDFFIVANRGHVWIVRFLANLFLRLFGLRTFKSKMTNRICLSFFVDTNHLNLQALTLPNKIDVYLHYWIASLIPLVNRNKTLEKFWQDNFWIKENLANWNEEGRTCDYRLIKEDSWLRKIGSLAEYFLAGELGSILENFLRLVQMEKINSRLSWKRHNKNDIVIKEGFLKFHTPDKREGYYNLWQEKFSSGVE